MLLTRDNGTVIELSVSEANRVYREVSEREHINDLKSEFDYYQENFEPPYDRININDEKYQKVLEDKGKEFLDSLWDYDRYSEIYWDICRDFCQDALEEMQRIFDESRNIKRENNI